MQVKTAYLDGYNQRIVNEGCVKGSIRCTAEESWETSEQKQTLDYWGGYDDGSFESLWNERATLRDQLTAANAEIERERWLKIGALATAQKYHDQLEELKRERDRWLNIAAHLEAPTV